MELVLDPEILQKLKILIYTYYSTSYPNTFRLTFISSANLVTCYSLKIEEIQGVRWKNIEFLIDYKIGKSLYSGIHRLIDSINWKDEVSKYSIIIHINLLDLL